jgi:hypothetical protein
MLVSSHHFGDFFAISNMCVCVCVGFVVFATTSMKSCKEEKEKAKHQEQDDKPNKQRKKMERRERGIHGGNKEDDDNKAKNGV